MADLFVAVGQEKFRLRDFIYGVTRSVQSQNALSAGLLEGIYHLSETPSNLSLTVNLSVTVTETMRLRDRIYGAARLPGTDLATGLIEQPRLASDSGQVVLQGLGAALKISDTVSVWMTDVYQAETSRISDIIFGASLGVSAAMLSTGLREQLVTIGESLAQVYIIRLPDENVRMTAGPGLVNLIDSFDPVLHIQDTVTVSLQSGSNLTVTVTQEALKLSDSVTVFENPEQTNGFDEALKVQDSATPSINPEQTSGFDEALKVADSLSAQLTVLFANGFDEALKVQDTVAISITPEFASGFDELLHVQDTVTVSMGGLSVTVTQESLKLADTVTVLLNPEQTSSPAESLKVQDSVTTLLNPLQTSGFDELVHVQDSGFVELQTEETLHVQDTVSVALTSAGTLTASGFDESLKLADVAFETLNPEQATVAESLKVQDTVQALVVSGGVGVLESLKVADAVAASLSPLRAGVQAESLTIVDSTPTLTGAPIAAAYLTAFMTVPTVGRMQIVDATGVLV